MWARVFVSDSGFDSENSAEGPYFAVASCDVENFATQEAFRYSDECAHERASTIEAFFASLPVGCSAVRPC